MVERHAVESETFMITYFHVQSCNADVVLVSSFCNFIIQLNQAAADNVQLYNMYTPVQKFYYYTILYYIHFKIKRILKQVLYSF